MEAPDKIFLNKYMLRRGMLYPAQYPADVPEFEYIRKDALLEWAKAEIELSKRVECVSEKSYEEGRQQVAHNLIDKLNSM